MEHDLERDYASSGLTIRSALVDHFKRFPDRKRRPRHIIWDGKRIITSDLFAVPKKGIIQCEILSAKGNIEQGFDLKVDGGIRLPSGQEVTRLRTWDDLALESFVEYPFESNNGELWVNNVYKMKYPGGQIVEEKWTENAGMWVEKVSQNQRIYHCSHGMATPPDFESLVFRIAISER